MKKLMWRFLHWRNTILKRNSIAYGPLSKRAKKPIESILLLAGCRLGDAVCYLPTLIALRKDYPNARIVLIVASNAAAEIIYGASLGIEVEVFSRGDRHWLVSAIYQLLKMRKQGFDVVLSDAGRNSFQIPLAAFFSGANWRIGALSERLHFLYNYKVNIPENTHVLELNRLFLLRAGLQAAISEFKPMLQPPTDCRVHASSLLQDAGIKDEEQLVGMTFGGSLLRHGKWDPMLKRWHVKGYAEVARWLIKNAKVCVAIFGVREDAKLAEETAKIGGVDIINMCGETSIGALQWLIQRCAVLITTDSGNMHLAAALGIPVLALFGPTSPINYGPKGEIHRIIKGEAQCSPCYPHPTCDLRLCLAMDSISASQIIDCLEGMLRSSTNGKYR